MTLHKHPRKEEFYFLLEGVGRMRINEQTITVQRHGGVLVGPKLLRQVFNDSEEEALWLIIGTPEAELEPRQENDKTLFYPNDPKQLPPELDGAVWPPTV